MERSGFFDRIEPGLIMALAVFHHVAFTGNVPLSQIALWMADRNADFIVEFVHRDDEKVQHLLSRKTDPESFDYSLDGFLEHTSGHFTVARQQMLSNGTRTMVHLEQL